MKKRNAKSLPEYDKVDFNEKDISEGLNTYKKIGRKMPTSVSLPPEIVEELKKLASKKGIPYQVLMRSFIIEGLERMKNS